MKFSSLFISIFSLCSLFSCGVRRQAEAMRLFSYSIQGMEQYGESFLVQRSEEGAEVTIIYHAEPFTVQTDVEIFADLQAIIDRYKVQNFKRSYQPKLEICDGEFWSLNIDYEDDTLNIHSSGNNAQPRKGAEALREFRAYFVARFVEEE